VHTLLLRKITNLISYSEFEFLWESGFPPPPPSEVIRDFLLIRGITLNSSSLSHGSVANKLQRLGTRINFVKQGAERMVMEGM
jgi:hypothetical protein